LGDRSSKGVRRFGLMTLSDVKVLAITLNKGWNSWKNLRSVVATDLN
jgi:hypothetical protein